MLSKYEAVNNVDENSNPTGGSVRGVGLSIDWQNGPLGRDKDCCNRNSANENHAPGCNGIIEKRKKPNGAFVETVIDACRQRIEAYQASKFKCRENALAITKLEEALHWLNARTQRRELQNVEGTHQGE